MPKYQPAIPSMSLGKPRLHPLPDKLSQASIHGFKGIELFYGDLELLAQSNFNNNLHKAAQYTHEKCKELNLHIICLQPFTFYEGLLDRNQHKRLVSEKLPLWFELAKILDTDLIQIPANFLGADQETGTRRTTGDRDVIIADLRELADKGLQETPRAIRFAYEALAWSNHIDTWEEAWSVVRAVDRPNFGICLDTFNIAGRVYADPSVTSGKAKNGEIEMKESMERLRRMIDVKKVFYVQVVDGERLSAPLDEQHPFHVPGQPVRMSWSRNARLFAFEEERGGYLPVLDVVRAVFDGLGFEGWVSLELFSRTLADPAPDTPVVHARRGMVSWGKLMKVLEG